MALALLPRYGGRLGDALVGLGVLRPVQLFRAISAQVRAKYLEAYRWRTGQWAFVPNQLSEEETFPLGHDTHELMRDGSLEAHLEELVAALEPLNDRVLVRASAPKVPLDAFRPPDHWHRLLDVPGDATLRNIVTLESEAGGLDREEVYRALYLGVSCGLIEAA